MAPPWYSQREIESKQDILNEKKRDLQIGIYGTFHPDYISHIESLKIALISAGYSTTRISKDIQSDPIVTATKSENITNFDCSFELLAANRVHLFIFCKGNETQLNLMQSATVELAGLFRDTKNIPDIEKQYVAVFFEDGYRETCNSVFNGMLEKGDPKITIAIYDFSDTQDIIFSAIQFCYTCVLQI